MDVSQEHPTVASEMSNDSTLVGWRAKVIRFSLFLGAPVDAAGLWNRVTGEQPVRDEKLPREGVHRQSGPWGDANLDIVSANARMDWLLTPQVSQTSTAIFIGDLETAVSSFDSAIKKWLDQKPEIETWRLAYGLIAEFPVPDTRAAYAKLEGLIPSVRLDSANSSEFFYQINRPKQSHAKPGMSLNRIMKWQSIVQHSYVGAMEAIGTKTPMVQTSEEHFAVVELDNSTPINGAPFAPELLSPIYSELRDMALENISKGEIP
jgi:hypothetical protein